jgi:[acyl-carrier-protein] S-malonyltransferase
MSTTAFLFPGQGSQSVGMMAEIAGKSPLVEQTFSQASGVLGYDLWDVCSKGPAERLGQTEITQPALLAAGIATWRVWKSLGGFNPDFLAGHSLGEYSALVAAGSLDFCDAITLVAERGRLMQSATPVGSGAMAAILGMDDDALADVCVKAAQGEVVSCANFNSPGQVVIAGASDAVARACALAIEAGAMRAIPLAVSAPSHCALMRPAAEKLEDVLGNVTIKTPGIPVIHNVDVTAYEDENEIRAALVRQLWQPVRWSDTIRALLGQGVERFAECGPGKVLAGLNRRISRASTTVALVDYASLAETAENWSQ